jgi:uncharacterized membrane protein YfcA
MHWDTAVVFLAAVAAGMINSVAGGGTLVSFPTLIWVGRDPIMANATNAVALWPGSAGAMYGFRKSLVGTRHWIILLGVPSVIGGFLGAALLLRTSSRTFSEVVPYLIGAATALLAFQTPLSRWLRATSDAPPTLRWQVGAVTFQFLVGVYGGYFGAGIGILMLAALGLLRFTDIYRMNALKNLFAVFINFVAAIYFTYSGAVLWRDALVMAAGAVAGGYGGAGLAQRVGPRIVRGVAVAVGIAMTVSLFLRR